MNQTNQNGENTAETDHDDIVDISIDAQNQAEEAALKDSAADEFMANEQEDDADADDETTDAASAEIEQLRAELADMKDKALRAMAEADNTRRRAEKERADTAKFAISSFAKNLLSVADNLRRALDAVSEDERKNNESFENICVGVEATERELLRAFDQAGITAIDAMGEKFNPNMHEVMFEAPVPGQENGMVFQVMEPGYMINERLLRPARVGVVKNAGETAPKLDEEV